MGLHTERNMDTIFCSKSETYVYNNFLYCTYIYIQSETGVYINLPVLYLRNLILHLTIKASILLYL